MITLNGCMAGARWVNEYSCRIYPWMRWGADWSILACQQPSGKSNKHIGSDFNIEELSND